MSFASTSRSRHSILLLWTPVLAAVFLLLSPPPTFAQLQNYLQLEGIPGESTSKQHPKWIEILGFHHSFTKPTNSLAPSFSTLQIVKLTDLSSPTIAGFVNSQRSIPSATLHATLPLEKEIVLLEIKLNKVTFQEYQQSGTQNARPVDRFSLNFEKITWTITHLHTDGSERGTSDFYWDLKSNTGGSSSLTLDIQEISPTEWGLSWEAKAGTTYQVLASPQIEGPYNNIDTVSATTTGPMTRKFAKLPGILFFRLSTIP